MAKADCSPGGLGTKNDEPQGVAVVIAFVVVLRSQFDWVVRCPRCGMVGHIWASEDEHAFRRNPHFDIEEVSSGFRVKNKGFSALDTEIVCEKCNVVV